MADAEDGAGQVIEAVAEYNIVAEKGDFGNATSLTPGGRTTTVTVSDATASSGKTVSPMATIRSRTYCAMCWWRE